MMIQTVPADEGETLSNLPSGDIEDSVKQSSVFPGGMMARGQNIWERRPIPGGLQHLEREVASNTPNEADLCSPGEQQCEHSRVPGACDIFYVPGAHDIFKCKGHKLSFNDHETMSPVLESCQSGLISSFCYYCNPTPNWSWGTTF